MNDIRRIELEITDEDSYTLLKIDITEERITFQNNQRAKKRNGN